MKTWNSNIRSAVLESMRGMRWLPLTAVAVVALACLSYAWSHPLPANGYGRIVYDVRDTVLTVPAGSSLSIILAAESPVPRGSLVLAFAGVMNHVPGSDLYETAYFRLTQAGLTLRAGVMTPFLHIFESRVDSSGAQNPTLFVRNDHAFDLSLDYRAFVSRPPTSLEHFELFLPLLVPLVLVAILWAIVPRRHRRNVGQIL
jgi:hypothetical protein